jgi:hypothetical protein
MSDLVRAAQARFRSSLSLFRSRLTASTDAGMVTVEYAIGTIAAAALATLLWEVARSPEVFSLIQQVFSKALTIPNG